MLAGMQGWGESLGAERFPALSVSTVERRFSSFRGLISIRTATNPTTRFTNRPRPGRPSPRILLGYFENSPFSKHYVISPR